MNYCSGAGETAVCAEGGGFARSSTHACAKASRELTATSDLSTRDPSVTDCANVAVPPSAIPSSENSNTRVNRSNGNKINQLGARSNLSCHAASKALHSNGKEKFRTKQEALQVFPYGWYRNFRLRFPHPTPVAPEPPCRSTPQKTRKHYLEPEGLEKLELIRFYPPPLGADRHQYARV